MGGRAADHRAHSEAFAILVRAILSEGRSGGRRTDRSAGEPTVADIGSGAGVPGLVLAQRLPDAVVTLIERRQGRVSWLEEAAGALGGAGIEVRVLGADVYDVAHGAGRGRYDVVTARAFGPPATTAELGGSLLVVGGRLVVSEPPDQPDRWDEVDLEALGLEDLGPEHTGLGRGPDDGSSSTAARFRVLIRRSPLPSHRPRRTPRSP